MTTIDWKTLLQRHPIFGRLTSRQIEQLVDPTRSRTKTYASGDSIIREGEFGDSIFVIGEGKVDVLVKPPSGDQALLYGMNGGEFFGEMAIFERRPRTATVVAREPCVVLEVDGERFLEVLAKKPSGRAPGNRKVE